MVINHTKLSKVVESEIEQGDISVTVEHIPSIDTTVLSHKKIKRKIKEKIKVESPLRKKKQYQPLNSVAIPHRTEGMLIGQVGNIYGLIETIKHKSIDFSSYEIKSDFEFLLIFEGSWWFGKNLNNIYGFATSSTKGFTVLINQLLKHGFEMGHKRLIIHELIITAFESSENEIAVLDALSAVYKHLESTKKTLKFK